MFTPGPWTYNGRPNHRCCGETHQVFEAANDENRICDVVGGDNARLVSMAPELLKALKAVAGRTSSGTLCWCKETAFRTQIDHDELCKAARAAIAEAGGEE